MGCSRQWVGSLRSRARLVLACGALLAAAPAAAQATSENIAALRKQQDRLVGIGERLTLAATPWCSAGHSLGWALGDLGQYAKDSRQSVRRAWALPAAAQLFVASTVPDGPAAAAGIVPGTGILSINGRTPMRNQYPNASRFALDNSEHIIDDALAAGPLKILTVAPDGTRREIELNGRPACPSRFTISPDTEEQAYADGDRVEVTIGMANYTADNDDELAAVVAHELAHNILRHLARRRAAGTPDDYTRYLGRYTRVSRKMEEEADRLSVWLLEKAGYDSRAPVTFWQRFGPGHDTAHPFGRTHDNWHDRVAAIENELDVMRNARANDRDARPALLDRARAEPGGTESSADE